MTIQILSLFSVVLLISYASCHGNAKSETAKIIWKLPEMRENPEAKVGKQMPPHHEPDAVLINTGGNGQPQVPEGSFPQFPGGGPGVFGFPRPGGGPGVNRPGFFPSTFVPRLPAYPNPFGIPGGQPFPANPGMQGVPHNPGMFFPPGQGGSLMPSGPNMYGVQMGQGGPGFTVRTGYFIPNGEPSLTGEPGVFGQPRIFTVAGGGHVPFPPASDFPTIRRMTPEAPIQPGFNSNGNFPGHEFYGGAGGREIYEDPMAEPFPIVEASPLFYDMFQY